MINIQVHGVKSVHWEPREHNTDPKILVIQTLEGDQRISLFPERQPSTDAEPDTPTKRAA